MNSKDADDKESFEKDMEMFKAIATNADGTIRLDLMLDMLNAAWEESEDD